MRINDVITPTLEKRIADAFIKADKASKQGRQARAQLTVFVMDALGADCECRLTDAKGNTTFSAAFTLADAIDKDWVAEISRGHNNAKGAIADAAIKRISGLPIVTEDMRVAWRDVCAVVMGLLGKGVSPDQVALSPKGNLQVPAFIMLKEPKDDAPESKWDEYEAACEKPFTLDGTKGRSFTELKAKVARQPRESEGGTAAFDAAAAFDQALDRIIDGLKTGDDESAIAFTEARLAKLQRVYDLIERLAA